MKKALLVTTVSGFIPQFGMNSVFLLQEHGYEVHYASNFKYPFYGKDNRRLDGTGIIRHQIDFTRTPYSKQTVIAYKQLSELMCEIKFDMIHCHTPLGGILGRLAARKNNIKKIIYTAHGFHFFKGANILNWLVYYPAERIMARVTDILITINEEDYEIAKKFKLKSGGNVYRLPGAGIDTKCFVNLNYNSIEKRKEIGISPDKFVILSVGELNRNKNHQVVIRALSNIEHDRISYLICGDGESKRELKEMVHKLKLDDCVKFLGFRTDIPELCKMSDLFVFPSFREGLPVSLMEAMASGLPVIASNVRGNVDLVTDKENGYLVSAMDIETWGERILFLMNNREELERMGDKNRIKMLQYDKVEVKKKLNHIYKTNYIYD